MKREVYTYAGGDYPPTEFEPGLLWKALGTPTGYLLVTSCKVTGMNGENKGSVRVIHTVVCQRLQYFTVPCSVTTYSSI